MYKHLARIGLSIAVSLTVLALLLQLVTSGLGEEQRPSVWAALAATTKVWLLAYLGLYFVQLYFRAARYRLLLDIAGEKNLPTLGQMALVTGIRNMFVDMLPARVGELGYVALLNRGYGVKLQHCMSSLGIAIVFDFVALFVIAIAIVAKQFLGESVEVWALNALMMIFIVTIVALLAVFYVLPWGVKTFRKPLAFSKAPKWWLRLLEWGEDFSQSITQVRRSGQLLKVSTLSLIIRLLKYTGMYLLFMAVAVPSFQSLANLPVEQIIGALVGGEVGASMPVPTFMSFGAYEAGSALVFQLLGVANQAEAFVTMLSVHIWSQLMDYMIGGTFLALFVLFYHRAKQLKSANGVDASGPLFKRWQVWGAYAFAALALGGATVFLALELWAASKLGATSAPEAGTVDAKSLAIREAELAASSGINGFVVFSSNRDGNHDIFKFELATSKLSKLTEHPHTETYPRISPDGERLVFARAHQPWVSQRNTKAWDVYVMDIATGNEWRVGTQGTAPHWIDNQRISYVRNTQAVEVVNIDSLQVETVFASNKNSAMPDSAQIHNARYNPITEQTTLTGRQSDVGLNTGSWGTAIVSKNSVQGVLNGCELAWNSAYTGLFQVTPSKRGSAVEIVTIDPQTLVPTPLIDLQGEFNHEYWPKDSNNGEYMVFGASRGPQDHEHDTKDYEIFLWKVGSPSDQATRLTFHTGNDNWPDVYIRD